ncbi:hypothetical protein COL30_09590 [Bacillus pseudomycoides]|nr:hypothetical protein CON99_02250 [Bacillus pseudomycoides]PED09896.1 hypothetical protein COO19_02660 [Bacillus pseudomycoides]PEI99096.1 hypothetical protein CN686_02495 [Bacillus pseudomycoides]PEK21094.1 hypothetical protein CN693_15465 [Bacillus pseudomycoides]PEM72818.1 hypothetical protein CN619_14755 [Bacillus pseudomycoides]
MKDGYGPLFLQSGEMKLFHNLGWYRDFFRPCIYCRGVFYFLLMHIIRPFILCYVHFTS